MGPVFDANALGPVFETGSQLAGEIVFRGVWAAFIHSNVRRPICPLRYLIGAPELHHWHHARVERTEHNFSNLAPWTDLVFGTARPTSGTSSCSPGKPVRSYLAWLVRPGA